jgi:RNA polymerase sigma-70 factor (ECF subfamily)
MPEEGHIPRGDDEILRRLREGDDEAFDEIVRLYQGDVYRLAYRLTGNPAEADDVAQETFLRAYQALPGFRGEASLRTWVLRIASNLSLNVLQSARVARRDPGHVAEKAPAVAPAGERGLLDKERQARLGSAIEALPNRQRTTLLLRVDQGLMFKEIARMMGCSTGTAKANFFHAVAALKRALRDLA